MSTSSEERPSFSHPAESHQTTSAENGDESTSGPSPTKHWKKYRVKFEDSVFLPECEDITLESVREKMAAEFDMPLESVTVTLESEYHADDQNSRWDASYYDGVEPQGTTCMSDLPFDANASVPDELVLEIQEEQDHLQMMERLRESTARMEELTGRLPEMWFTAQLETTGTETEAAEEEAQAAKEML
ncbi:hypothetical protein IAR50_002525 [Cryptococcus sp. DSM 104548]